MSNRNKKSRLPGLKTLAAIAAIAVAAYTAINKRARTFVGSKLTPVRKFIPGQVAPGRAKGKNTSKETGK